MFLNCLYLSLLFYQVVTATATESSSSVNNNIITTGNLNTLLFVNQGFLNCPLKKAKLNIEYKFNDSDIIRRLPCKNNIEQFKLLLNNYLNERQHIKASLLTGWNENDACKNLLSINDDFFSVANLTICHCFVEVQNDAVTKSSFETVKTCERLMQKWRLCQRIDDLLSMVRGNHNFQRRRRRRKRSDSTLLIK